jgi:hypothetical protein
VTDFVSYYWLPEALEDKHLIDEFERLLSKNSTMEEKIKSFGMLLESENTVAQCIAFDHFFYRDSLLRYGVDNSFYHYQDELLKKARNQLRSGAVVSTTPRGKKVYGANYASAFGVLTHLGEEKDIELVDSIFQASRDMEVLYSGCLALKRCLGVTKKFYPSLLSSISRIIYDDRQPEDLRVIAIGALADYEIPEVDELLVEVSQKCGLPLCAYAATLLGSRNFAQYRDLLQQLADSWPEDARYPASEVRDLLESNATDAESH